MVNELFYHARVHRRVEVNEQNFIKAVLSLKEIPGEYSVTHFAHRELFKFITEFGNLFGESKEQVKLRLAGLSGGHALFLVFHC